MLRRGSIVETLHSGRYRVCIVTCLLCYDNLREHFIFLDACNLQTKRFRRVSQLLSLLTIFNNQSFFFLLHKVTLYSFFHPIDSNI